MHEREQRFTPYVPDEEILRDDESFLPPGRAERVAELVAKSMDRLRGEHPFEDLQESEGLQAYIKHSEERLRLELDGQRLTSPEYMVAAAHHAQRGAALDSYLRHASWLKGQDKQRLVRDRNIAYAGAEQSTVKVLLREDDERAMKAATQLLSVVRATPWQRSVSQTLDRLRNRELDEVTQQRVAGFARGVAGHAAAVRITRDVLDTERSQRAYAADAVLDGLHGVDFGLHGVPPSSARLETIVQVKVHEKQPEGIVVIPVAGDRRHPYQPLLEGQQTAEASREQSLKRLDVAVARLRSEEQPIVSRDVIGLLVELRAAPFGTSWREIIRARDGQFDIFTGLYNDQLLAAAKREYNRLAPEIKRLREQHRDSPSPHARFRRQRVVH